MFSWFYRIFQTVLREYKTSKDDFLCYNVGMETCCLDVKVPVIFSWFHLCRMAQIMLYDLIWRID